MGEWGLWGLTDTPEVVWRLASSQERQANSRLAVFNQELIDNLRDHYLNWYDENGNERLNWAGRGPLGNWSQIENFLKTEYPAAHKGLTTGKEEVGKLLDSGYVGEGADYCPTCHGRGFNLIRTNEACKSCEGSGVPDKPLAYETGPDAVAQYGYDPKETAAGMLLLHNKTHPERGDILDADIDRLSDIAQKRSEMQRNYEQKQPVTAHRLAMAWEDYKDKIQGGCKSCYDGPGGWEGRYTIPQAGAFLNYSHGTTYKGDPVLNVVGIYTHPTNRNDGVAEALMRRLSEDHPGIPINPGYMTPDGQNFHDKMLEKEPSAKDLVTARNITDTFRVAAAMGDCYEAAAKYIVDHALGMGVKEPNHNLRVVHGEVAGQGPLQGQTLGHAWVEDGDTVIDQSNGRDVRLPKSVYYQLGKINELNNFHSYSPEEARGRLMDLQHYGPWDLSINGEPPPGRMELDDDEDDEYYEDDDDWMDDDDDQWS